MPDNPQNCDNLERCARTGRLGSLVLMGVVVAALLAWLVVRVAPTRTRIATLSQPSAASPGSEAGAQAKLYTWTEVLRIPTGLPGPARALAVGADGRLYVAGGQVYRVYTPAGQVQLQVPLFSPAQALAVNPQGQVYLAMRDHVEIYNPAGQPVSAYPSLGARAYLTSIAPRDKEVWVANAGERLILRYDQAAQVVGRLGGRDDAKKIPGLIVPSPYLDLAFAPNGVLWVNNPGRLSLEAYWPDGSLHGSVGRSGGDLAEFPGCCNPTHLAVLPDGKLVTSQKGLPIVKVFTPAGALESVVAGSEAFSEGTTGLDLATDKSGRVYVLDPRTQSVRVYARAGGGKP